MNHYSTRSILLHSILGMPAGESSPRFIHENYRRRDSGSATPLSTYLVRIPNFLAPSLGGTLQYSHELVPNRHGFHDRARELIKKRNGNPNNVDQGRRTGPTATTALPTTPGHNRARKLAQDGGGFPGRRPHGFPTSNTAPPTQKIQPHRDR